MFLLEIALDQPIVRLTPDISLAGWGGQYLQNGSHCLFDPTLKDENVHQNQESKLFLTKLPIIEPSTLLALRPKFNMILASDKKLCLKIQGFNV